ASGCCCARAAEMAAITAAAIETCLASLAKGRPGGGALARCAERASFLDRLRCIHTPLGVLDRNDSVNRGRDRLNRPAVACRCVPPLCLPRAGEGAQN